MDGSDGVLYLKQIKLRDSSVTKVKLHVFASGYCLMNLLFRYRALASCAVIVTVGLIVTWSM